MGSSYASAPVVVSSLAATQWKLFDSMRNIQDDRATAAEGILGRVKDALCSDQHVADLGPVLRLEQSKAIDLLTPAPTGGSGTGGTTTTSGSGSGGTTVTPPPKKAGKTIVDTGSRDNLTLDEAENEIGRLRKQVKDKQTARVNVSWVVEE